MVRVVVLMDPDAWPSRVVEVAVFREAEDVEEALEWVWTWWMERTEETDEEVDLRPRRPALERR